MHTLLNKSTRILALGLFGVYMFSFLLFSPFYWMVRDECGLEFRDFRSAFFLSVETMTTIGFGIPNSYMDGCLDGMVIITLQSIFSAIVNAVTVGLFWLRLSRVQKRASSVAFSDRAVIQEIRGSLYFMFQIVEMRKHQLVEAHVRLYSLRHAPTFVASTMRLQRPDDELNGFVMLAMPSVVVHRIDNWSPLSPPADPKGPHDPSTDYLFPDIPQVKVQIKIKVKGSLLVHLLPRCRRVGQAAAHCRDGAWTRGGTRGKWATLAHEATPFCAPPHIARPRPPISPPLFLGLLQRLSDAEVGMRSATGIGPGMAPVGGPAAGVGGAAAEGPGSAAWAAVAAKRRAVKRWLEESGSEVLAMVEGEENVTGSTVQVGAHACIGRGGRGVGGALAYEKAASQDPDQAKLALEQLRSHQVRVSANSSSRWIFYIVSRPGTATPRTTSRGT